MPSTEPQSTFLKAIDDLRTFASGVFESLRGPHTISPENALHPEFLMKNEIWYQNQEWGPRIAPPMKVGFFLNDLGLLSGCPFVCKFGENNRSEIPFRFFGVAYGDPSEWHSNYGLSQMMGLGEGIRKLLANDIYRRLH